MRKHVHVYNSRCFGAKPMRKIDIYFPVMDGNELTVYFSPRLDSGHWVLLENGVHYTIFDGALYLIGGELIPGQEIKIYGPEYQEAPKPRFKTHDNGRCIQVLDGETPLAIFYPGRVGGATARAEALADELNVQYEEDRFQPEYHVKEHALTWSVNNRHGRVATFYKGDDYDPRKAAVHMRDRLNQKNANKKDG